MTAGMNIARSLAALLIAALPVASLADNLTLETIMPDPDWLGNAPENACWGSDSRHIHFEQRRPAPY